MASLSLSEWASRLGVWLASLGWVDAAVATVLVGLLAWHQVARRRRAEHSAAQAEAMVARLALAVRQSGEAVVSTDAARRIVWVNQAFTQISGYSEAECLGRSPGELLQFEGTDPLVVVRMRQALDAEQHFDGEVLNRSRDGRIYWVELRMQPLRDARGRLDGFISFQADVTDRKLAEAEMKESRSLLDKIDRIGGVGGWVLDLTTHGLQWTEQALRLMEAGPGFQPSLKGCLRLVAPPARAQVRQMLRRPLADCSSWDLELPLVTRRGRPIWVHLVAEAEFGDQGPERVVGAMQDITARRELKNQLKRQAELLRGAFEAVDEAFALFDPLDRLVFCNDRYRHLFTTTREVIVEGATFEHIVRTGAERGQYEAAAGREDAWVAQRLAVFRAADRTLVQRLGNGRILRVIDRRMPDGHTVTFCVDITELVSATEAAERADRAKAEFIATISHELRTPLQAITGFSDLGRHFANGHPQYEPMFEDIHAAGMRMLKLVNGLLDVSKIDGSVGSLKLLRAPLWPLVDEVLRELSPIAMAGQVRFVTPPSAPQLVGEVDGFRLQQVLRNVLANALRFAPAGSTVTLDGRDLGPAGVELTVQDQGPGVPADELESVFQPFVQSSRTRDGSGGTGLGLAICRRIMGAHAGSIVIESPDEGGALVRMRLPAAPEPAPAGIPGRRLLRSSARPASEPIQTTVSA